MVYLKYVENVIPLSKLIGLLFLFCLPLLSILFLKTKRNDLARPVMGTIFLVTVDSSNTAKFYHSPLPVEILKSCAKWTVFSEPVRNIYKSIACRGH